MWYTTQQSTTDDAGNEVLIMKLSEKIELMICILEQSAKDYEWYSGQLADADKKKTDLYHELEGVGVEHTTPPNYQQRAVLATRLQDALLTRRIAKDAVDIHEPLFEFTNSALGKDTLKRLKSDLGAVRKREQNKEYRKYHKRAADLPPVNPELEKLIRLWKQSTKDR